MTTPWVRIVWIGTACWLACSALAQPRGPAPPSEDAVMKELSRRTGLSRQDLQELTRDCNAHQQSMYFCAFRDFIAADLELQRAVSDKLAHESEQCRTVFDAKQTRWERARDRVCNQSARKEWGGGSMQPTAEVVCKTASTEARVREVNQRQICGKAR